MEVFECENALLVGKNAPHTSSADVRESATIRSKKPRRKACSTGRKAASPGLGGTPTRRFGISKRISRNIALPTL